MLVYAIGFLAQGFFAARTLVQWILSERARQVLSPTLFWALSLAGAYLQCFYGWLRHDFAIILGQFFAYYTYLWNLAQKGLWHNMPRLSRLILLLTPMVALVAVLDDMQALVARFFHNDDIPLWLLVFGSAGQSLFTFRFIYQWCYCRRIHRSELPTGFWVISLVGALSILGYAVIRLDPVLIVGHSLGIVIYSRNLLLIRNSRKAK